MRWQEANGREEVRQREDRCAVSRTGAVLHALARDRTTDGDVTPATEDTVSKMELAGRYMDSTLLRSPAWSGGRIPFVLRNTQRMRFVGKTISRLHRIDRSGRAERCIRLRAGNDIRLLMHPVVYNVDRPSSDSTAPLRPDLRSRRLRQSLCKAQIECERWRHLCPEAMSSASGPPSVVVALRAHMCTSA